jgi:hypothetical protein
MPHRCILTPAERTALLAFPSERSELIRLYRMILSDFPAASLINSKEICSSLNQASEIFGQRKERQFFATQVMPDWGIASDAEI